MGAHSCEQVAEVGWAHGAVIGASDFGYASFAGFGGKGIVSDEAEAIVTVFEEGFWLRGLGSASCAEGTDQQSNTSC